MESLMGERMGEGGNGGGIIEVSFSGFEFNANLMLSYIHRNSVLICFSRYIGIQYEYLLIRKRMGKIGQC
jgi:hypothetical protein